MQNVRGAPAKILSSDDVNGLVAILNLTKQVPSLSLSLMVRKGGALVLMAIVCFIRWPFAANQRVLAW
jgi:hypothetical protein